jgi:hypothetical protein
MLVRSKDGEGGDGWRHGNAPGGKTLLNRKLTDYVASSKVGTDMPSESQRRQGYQEVVGRG